MTSTMGAILAAIAAVVVTFGYILFGKPKAETTRTIAQIEKVQSEPTAPTVSVPIVSETKWVEPSIADPILDTNADPWNEEITEETSTAALTLDTVEQEGLLDEQSSEDIPVELNLDDATQVNEVVQSSLEISTARYGVLSDQESLIRSQTFVAIRDPNCPPLDSQELSQQILAWGQSGTAENLKTVLSYAKHPEAVIRRYVAVAIGQVMAVGTIGAEIQSAVPVLETLTVDSDAKVQKIAAKSLKGIQG
ncbi:MAG: hypothetical protein LH631_11665 [Alkalinema sp. CAN_BIN05]|nr:hypothetical protein [Alkalinema sp. CAN_BIN05]